MALLLVPLDWLNAFGGLREINAAEQLGEKVCVRFAVVLIERQGGDIILIIVVGTLCYSGCVMPPTVAEMPLYCAVYAALLSGLANT